RSEGRPLIMILSQGDHERATAARDPPGSGDISDDCRREWQAGPMIGREDIPCQTDVLIHSTSMMRSGSRNGNPKTTNPRTREALSLETFVREGSTRSPGS